MVITKLEANDKCIIIDDCSKYYNPALQSTYLIDKTNQLKFDDISSREYQNKFILNEKEIPHFGFESSTIWIKFSIQNLLTTSPYLEIDNPVLDTIDYYLVNKGGLLVHQYTTGNHVKIENRNLQSSDLMIDLNLTDDDTYTCYLKINSKSSTILAPMGIASLEKFYKLKNIKWKAYYNSFTATRRPYLLSP